MFLRKMLKIRVKFSVLWENIYVLFEANSLFYD